MAPEHYPRGTLECTGWCGVCGRMTQHRVDFPVGGAKGGGRRGPCLEHEARGLTKKQEKRREKAEHERQQPSLFGAKK